jgi:diacylglycerol kinase family enzyme
MVSVHVVLNVGAGSVSSDETREEVRRVSEAFRGVNLDARVEVVEAPRLSDAVSAAASAADVVVVGGGDGTISTAAAVLAGARRTLGVLPLGTLNHFAKDLNIPTDLEGAARTIAAAHVREVDLGEVNGRVFINNSSIGLYPRIVSDREAQQEKLGRGKWRAMAHAALANFRHFRLWRVRLQTNGARIALATPFVFIGNNRYEMRLFSPGQRLALDRGELSFYFARNARRWGILRLLIHFFTGRLDQAQDFHSGTAREVLLESTGRRLRVALDGEITRLEPPLRYRIRPRELRVLAPPPDRG